MSRLPLVLLVAAVLGAQGLNLVDPSELVDDLSQPLPNEGTEGKWKPPPFCGNSDCPPYKVEKETDNYEIRTYSSGRWAVTNVTDQKYELAYTRATSRLIRYFKGGNEEKESIELTTPTLSALRFDKEGESTEKDYGFSYWLPEDYQRKPPKPTDGDVTIVKFPEVTVYVSVFAGYATEGTIVKEAKALHSLLKDDEQDFDESQIFVAVYDPPQKLLNRHNEVHIPVAEKQPASA